jgi:subtilisin family serine protease
VRGANTPEHTDSGHAIRHADHAPRTRSCSATVPENRGPANRSGARNNRVPQIGGPAAWARGFTGAGIVVAVLDSGVDASHPDLAGKVIDAESFVDGATWSSVPGLAADDHWLGLVVHPVHAAFASLRGTVEDVDGRRNAVTIIRAYRIAAPSAVSN